MGRPPRPVSYTHLDVYKRQGHNKSDGRVAPLLKPSVLRSVKLSSTDGPTVRIPTTIPPKSEIAAVSGDGPFKVHPASEEFSRAQPSAGPVIKPDTVPVRGEGPSKARRTSGDSSRDQPSVGPAKDHQPTTATLQVRHTADPTESHHASDHPVGDQSSAGPSKGRQSSVLLQVQPSAGPAKDHQTSDPPVRDQPCAGPSQDPLSIAYAAALGATLSSDSEMETEDGFQPVPSRKRRGSGGSMATSPKRTVPAKRAVEMCIRDSYYSGIMENTNFYGYYTNDSHVWLCCGHPINFR